MGSGSKKRLEILTLHLIPLLLYKPNQTNRSHTHKKYESGSELGLFLRKSVVDRSYIMF